jgi:predicted histidine transporter YuiF (NhaC family)
MNGFFITILFGVATFLIAALALIIVVWIIRGRIDLKFLIADEAGDASMSRLQLLIFTFVVAVGLIRVLEATGSFPDIPNSILVLVGVSGSTYAIGKAVNSSPTEEANAGTNPPVETR